MKAVHKNALNDSSENIAKEVEQESYHYKTNTNDEILENKVKRESASDNSDKEEDSSIVNIDSAVDNDISTKKEEIKENGKNEPSEVEASNSETIEIEKNPSECAFQKACVKRIMKLDDNVGKVSAPAIIVVSKAAEMFVQRLAKNSYDISIRYFYN